LVERLTIGLVGVTARQEEVVVAVTWCRAGALSWYSLQSPASASIRGVVVLPAVRFDGAPEFHGLLVGDGVHGVVSVYSASSRATRRSWAATQKGQERLVVLGSEDADSGHRGAAQLLRCAAASQWRGARRA
jgi:hypothetical protein